MTLQQLADLKRWHVDHRSDHPVEFHAWDGVLTLWVMGWIGLAPAVLLDQPLALVACAAAMALPRGYVALRRRLHRQRQLRCDWLDRARG